jgi:hypothetical protein
VLNKLFDELAAWCNAPGCIVCVLVKNQPATGADGIGEFCEKYRRRRNEASHPPNPGGVKPRYRQRIGHQIQFVETHMLQPAGLASGLAGLHESGGSFDGHHFAGGPNQVRQVQGRVSGPRADVENPRTDTKAGLLPTGEDRGPPDIVLQPEALNLLLIRA